MNKQQFWSFVSSGADFLFFWGVVFLISTTLVAIFKRENVRGRRTTTTPEETQGVMETYKLLLSIIKMPTVFTFCLLLLTAKVIGHYWIHEGVTFGYLPGGNVIFFHSLCVSDGFLCSRCGYRSEADGGWSSQRAASIASSAHGTSPDLPASGHQ